LSLLKGILWNYGIFQAKEETVPPSARQSSLGNVAQYLLDKIKKNSCGNKSSSKKDAEKRASEFHYSFITAEKGIVK